MKATVLRYNEPKAGAKSVKVQFETEHGKDFWAYANLSTFCLEDFEEGKEAELETKTVPTDDGSFESVQAWDGKAYGKKPGFGGGGGSKWQPKSPGDIAVMQTCALGTAVAALVGKLVEFGVCKDLKAVSEAYNALYGVALSETLAGIRQVKAEVS